MNTPKPSHRFTYATRLFVPFVRQIGIALDLNFLLILNTWTPSTELVSAQTVLFLVKHTNYSTNFCC
jgi:hypothetical protein